MKEPVPESASLARLRNAWLDSTHVPTGEACLAPEWIWDAVTGAHDAAALDAGLGHVAQCARCTEAWRVAHELLVATGQAPRGRGASPTWQSWRVWLPAAAALVVLVGGVGSDRGWFERSAPIQGDVDVVRGATSALTSTMNDPSCDRGACRLTWSDAGPGARYEMRVTTPGLDPIASVNGLEIPAHVIPPAALSTLAPNAELLWRVDAVLPDGRRVSSPTFVVTVR